MHEFVKIGGELVGPDDVESRDTNVLAVVETQLLIVLTQGKNHEYIGFTVTLSLPLGRISHGFRGAPWQEVIVVIPGFRGIPEGRNERWHR